MRQVWDSRKERQGLAQQCRMLRQFRTLEGHQRVEVAGRERKLTHAENGEPRGICIVFKAVFLVA